MVLSFSICNVSVAPLRSEPSHRAEQVTQLLFGDKAEIIEINDKGWAHIRSEWDDYEGWCKFSQLAQVNPRDYKKQAKYISGSNADRLLFEQGEMWLPAGCDLMGLKAGKITTPSGEGKYKGKKIAVKNLVFNAKALKDAAFQFLHAPYLWGGKTIAGIDCSGLTQMAFKMCHTRLPRDASQQAQEGKLVDFLQHAECGDLAFFDNADGKIVHVGILLDNNTIIHATDAGGRVVTDSIDQEGIISRSLKKRTHHLRFVKRFL